MTRSLAAVEPRMHALQESVRPLRGIASAQVDGSQVSVRHSNGCWFTSAGTALMTNLE